VATGDAATPMFRQYRALKEAHPGHLLFYRMGDFYELFFDDAVQAAPALDIALTRRGQHNGALVPMCGVPVHSAESYLHRLIRKGFKVAICEQVEDPAEARRRGGSKALVRREVVRIVTPGTLTEDGLLEARRHNYLAALGRSQGTLGLAWVDISTGAFRTMPVTPETLAGELARIEPGELLVPETFGDSGPDLAEWRERITLLPPARFDSIAGERRLQQAFGVAALEGFGAFGRAEIAAAGALLDYVELTQKGRLPHLSPPRREEPGRVMAIDAATRRNLELLQSLGGERRGSLLHAVDRTVTGAGGRLLAERLAAPLTDAAAIRRRLDAVEALVDDGVLREELRRLLKGTPDLERALSRLTLGRGGPRDLGAIRAGLERAAAIAARLEAAEPAVAALAGPLQRHEGLTATLAAALVDEPPHLAREGGFVRPGHRGELDELRDLREGARRRIAALEARLRDEAGIPSLKIRHNNMLGYYVEVTAVHRAKVPAGFVQRQSMSNATRYTTEELAGLEMRIGEAAERALALELELFEGLVGEVAARAEAVGAAARALARLDVAAGLAELAVEARWARPELEESTVFVVEGGRHPVVERALEAEGRPFVANDCDLSPQRRLWLLTGPNMAGKSTYLRQNALIALLAQTGAFVPAARAVIGIVDRLFSRVGAADDLARGRSTFMVEMVETAAILNQATGRSLVVLDEIGRGTATYDGLSIAWAVVEHLHEVVGCRALFATHYHELTALAARLPRLACHAMRVKKWQGEVVFLHEVAEGSADRSYGIHVARLAGLPGPVLARAEEVLRRLEQGEAAGAAARLADDLPLFQAALQAEPPPRAAGPSPLEETLAAIVADDLSPREALELVYRLKSMAGK
jgi:DNA mismatch repair protein MutS